MGGHDSKKAKDAFSECWLLNNKEIYGSPGEVMHLILSAQGAVWSCNIYYKSWLAFLCTFSFSLPSNPPLTLLLSNGIWKEIIKLYSCSNSSCLQGGLGNPCQFLCCAGLLRALMCAPGSSPLSQLQHKVVCRLWKQAEISESGMKGTAWLVVWISCVRESYRFRYYGTSRLFSLHCISVWHFDFAWFFSLYLFPFPSPDFPLCFSVPSPLFIFFLTFGSLFFYLLKSFHFPLTLEILILFLSISSHISFLSLFSPPAVLPKLLLFLPSLPDLLYSAVFCTAPFSLPPKSPLHYSLSLVAGAAAVAIWDTPRGMEWGGGWWCWGGAVPHVFLPRKRRKDLPVQVLGQWLLSTGWGSFI